MTEPTADFSGLGLSARLLQILTQKKFTVPTPIQRQAIPVAMAGKDLIGIAQTGTGKTLAFGLPLIDRALANAAGSALVVVPTRELAHQVEESIRAIGAPLGIVTAVLIGGESMSRQTQMLRRRPHITIATPGRLLDHVSQGVSLKNVRAIVLDEADRMLDMGFAPDIMKILKLVPTPRQMMLFSATMPAPIADLAKRHLHLPLRIEVAPAGTAARQINQEMIVVAKEFKLNVLTQLLEKYTGTVLVFSRTRHGAQKVSRVLNRMGYPSGEIHSDRSQSQRKAALAAFKEGRTRILVATDIAARGIDVQGIELVVNFDLPDAAEDYVHRIGRTARAGRTGTAISLATPDQLRDIAGIERLIQKQLPKHRHTPSGQTEPMPAFIPETRPVSRRPARRPYGHGASSSRNSRPTRRRY